MTERWEDFLKRYCWNELVELSNYYPERRSLLVKFADMDLYDPDLADMVLESPDVAITAATRALRSIDLPTGVALEEANFRVIKVPRRLKIRDIRSEDIGKLVCIEGLVTKATEVRPKIVVAVFECPFCHHVFSLEQSGREFKEPTECDQESGGCGRKIQHFKLLVEQCKFANAQKIRLQESPEELRGGELPQVIDVHLEDDLTGVVSPGDRVIITGILRSYQRSSKFGKTPFFDIYLEGNSLEQKEEEFEEIKITEEDERRIMELKNQPDIYDKLIKSIAPSIYGYEEIKEAMVLQLFAGVSKELPDETRIRGDIHVLLVGDPGVAKSQLLTYLVKLAPRGLYTGGKSSTSAGLTAAAVKDEFGEGRWTLEAGALVLADKGIAAVDEIDKMRKEDRDALHEAMEQQSFAPSFELTLATGDKKAIGELVDGLMNEDKENVIKGVNCEILPLKNKTLRILTTDFDRIFETQIDRVSRHLAPGYFIEISLQNGRTVKITPEHPCWVVRNGRITTIPAEEVVEGEYLPIPAYLPIHGESQHFNFFQDKRNYRKEIGIPAHSTPEFCRFLGYHLSDGSYELNRGVKNGINFWNSDPVLIEDYTSLVKNIFGVEPYIQMREKRKGVRITSMHLVDFLHEIDPSLLMDGKRKRIPPLIMKARKEEISQLLRALFDGDGGVFWSQRNGVRVKLTIENREMAEQVQELLCRFGIRATIFEESENIYRVDITGQDNLRIFYHEIGFLSPAKRARLEKYLRIKKTYRTQIELVPNVKDSVLETAKKLRISLRKVFGYSHDRAVKNMQKEKLKAYVLLFESRLSEVEEVMESIRAEQRWRELKRVRRDFRIPMTEIARVIGVSTRTIRNWEDSEAGSVERYRSALITALERMLASKESVSELRKLAFGEVSWCRVKKVEKIENKDVKWVYDVTVEPYHTFISNNMVLHNTVSVAKAGIMARLNSRCGLLAAANPKYGRFDKYTPIAEQINMPPTLLSRFDLIFTMMDRPDEELDMRTAEHIIEAHYAGELLARLENIGKMDIAEKEHFEHAVKDMEPPIEGDLLRKYVAWSKRNVFPVMSEGAKRKFLDFYIGLRRQGYEDEDAPVPVTARQLEALIRLGEARARARLSDQITEEDAERVIELVKYCLNRVFVDPETGRLDADWVTVGITKTRRDRARSIREIIKDLEREYGEEVPLDEVLDIAEEEGMERDKAEEIIEVMKRDGILFSPSSGVIKFVR